MTTDWGDAEGKDWGGSEVHDWGLTPASDATPIPGVPLARADDPIGDPLPTGVDAEAQVDTDIASAVFVALNNWKHSSLATESEGDGPTEYILGTGDSTVYAIDDGRDHAMIGRAVGEDDEGCVYCLVGRVGVGQFQALSDGDAHPEAAFDEATDISLSSVFQDDKVTNVVLVQHYDRIEDVPSEYRPPSPFYMFTDE